MARVPAWVLGSIIWGDQGLQASAFADDPNPHRNPQAGDLDWNSLKADYLSQTDATAQTIASFLGLGGPASNVSAVQVQDGPLGSPITATTFPILLGIGDATANKLGLANQTYVLVSAAGNVDLNGQTNPTMWGLNFNPSVLNSGSATTVGSIEAIRAFPKTVSFAANTITNLICLHLGITHFIGNPTVTTAWGIKIDPIGRTTYSTIYGLDIGTLTGTTKVGIREQSTGVNLLSSKTRFGDQTTPTRTLEVNGGLAVPVNTQTANYTILLTDHYVLGDATAGAITLTLPASSSSFANNVSQRLSIKKKDASVNTVTIAAAGADTIQGTATVVLAAQYSERTLYTDGTGTWYVESSI